MCRARVRLCGASHGLGRLARDAISHCAAIEPDSRACLAEIPRCDPAAKHFFGARQMRDTPGDLPAREHLDHGE